MRNICDALLDLTGLLALIVLFVSLWVVLP